MAYYDWRAFMPDPNRPRLGEMLSGVADTLMGAYEDRKLRKRREEQQTAMIGEMERCRNDPGCDESSLFSRFSEDAAATGDLQGAEVYRKLAVERRQQAEHSLDVRGEERMAAAAAADPVNVAIREYTEEHGVPPDSGMVQDIRAAVAQREAQDELRRTVATGEASPYQVELLRCRETGGMDCEEHARAYEDALTTEPEKNPPKNKQAALDNCIDTLIVGRGGNPDNQDDWTIDDLVTCENMYETGKRKHREDLDRAYDAPAPGTTDADGNPALSKGLRAKLGDLMTDMDVGGWEQGWGRPADVTNAYHAEAARQLRAGDGRMWAERMPTIQQQKILEELREVIAAPIVPKANQTEEDAELEHEQKASAARAVYQRLRPQLGPVQQHHLDLEFGEGEDPVAVLDEGGNVSNEEANEDAAESQSADSQFPSEPVDRTGGGLLALAGQKVRGAVRKGRQGYSAAGRGMHAAARAQSPGDYGASPEAAAPDAAARQAIGTLRGARRGRETEEQQSTNRRQGIGPPVPARSIQHLLGGPVVGDNALFELAGL